LAALPASESQALPRVRRLRRRDYVGYSAKLASRMLQSRVLGWHRPLLVNIEPTHRCNLDCVYCDKVDPKSPQMETNAALHMLDQLAALGTLSVCFDGGEPLVHPGIQKFGVLTCGETNPFSARRRRLARGGLPVQ
jgi:hypothetical protein